jgi:hypothetical protein
MFCAFESLGEKTFLKIAEESLQFLYGSETRNDTYVPVGNAGWYTKGGQMALFDQQPIEPGAMVETAAIAYRLTKRQLYEDMARKAMLWFLGENIKCVRVYDEETGACYDGVGSAGLNENQGAESTIAFLLASYELIESSI